MGQLTAKFWKNFKQQTVWVSCKKRARLLVVLSQKRHTLKNFLFNSVCFILLLVLGRYLIEMTGFLPSSQGRVIDVALSCSYKLSLVNCIKHNMSVPVVVTSSLCTIGGCHRPNCPPACSVLNDCLHILLFCSVGGTDSIEKASTRIRVTSLFGAFL